MTDRFSCIDDPSKGKKEMKRCLYVISMLLFAVAANATTPQYQISLDTQEPNRKWELNPVYVGATPLIRGNLYENGTGWTPSTNWTGFFWYGTNTDWSATNVVTITGVWSNGTYVDFQATSATFSDLGVYYGGVVMTNVAAQKIEWGLGRVYTAISGGIGDISALTTTSSIYMGYAEHGETAYQTYVSNVVAGAGITTTTNGRSVTVASTCGTNAITNITATVPIVVSGIGQSSALTFVGTNEFDASGATNLNGSSVASGTVAEVRIASTIARDSEVTTATNTLSAAIGTTITTATNTVEQAITAAYGAADALVGGTNGLAQVLANGNNAGGGAITNLSKLAYGDAGLNIAWEGDIASYIHIDGDVEMDGALDMQPGREMNVNHPANPRNPVNLGYFGSNAVDAATLASTSTADRVYSVNAANHTNRPFHETVAFIATNATYETIWFGPWPSALTLSSAFSQVDFGTQGVYIVEKSTSALWWAYASTNIFLISTTTGTNGTAFDDATVAAGNLLGVQLWTGTSTQGLVTVQGTW